MCRVDEAQVWMMNLNPFEVKLQPREWLADLGVAEEVLYLWKDPQETEVPTAQSDAVKAAVNREECGLEYGTRLIQQVCLEGSQLSTRERRAF